MKSTKCNFFASCGGCSYLDLPDEQYRQKKILDVKQYLEGKKLFDVEKVNFVWIGSSSRRRIILQIDNENKLGFFAKSSQNIVEIDSCYVSDQEISRLILPLKNIVRSFENNLFTKITVTAFDNVLDVIFDCKRQLNFSQLQKIINFSKGCKINASIRIKKNLTQIFITSRSQIFYPNFKLNLVPNIFIQATKSGADEIISTIARFISANFSKKINIADIYAGFGSYSFAIVDFAKEIMAFEGAEEMVNMIKENSAANGLSAKLKSEMRDLMLFPISNKELEKFDLVIMNPPRNGATPQVKQISKSSVKSMIYISCDIKSFARDASILTESGFKIVDLVAIDQFYGSAHIELVAIFTKDLIKIR